MHFVTGGAFNGKSSWVREYYRIEESISWFSGCRGDELPGDLQFVEGLMVVIEGIEHWIKELLTNHDAEEVRELVGSVFAKLASVGTREAGKSDLFNWF